MFTQTPINGSKCCVMWVVLPVRVRGSVHSCCLSTVSTCLAIHEHHLGLFLEWIPDHWVSTLLNSHYLQHAQPTLQVMRNCRQCHLPWKLCISVHKVKWTFLHHFKSAIIPEVCRWTYNSSCIWSNRKVLSKLAWAVLLSLLWLFCYRVLKPRRDLGILL